MFVFKTRYLRKDDKFVHRIWSLAYAARQHCCQSEIGWFFMK